MILSKAAVAAEVRRYESRAKQAGIEVADLCKRSEIDRATWQRWKAALLEPKIFGWERVKAEVAKLPRKLTKASVGRDND